MALSFSTQPDELNQKWMNASICYFYRNSYFSDDTNSVSTLLYVTRNTLIAFHLTQHLCYLEVTSVDAKHTMVLTY